MKPPVPLSDRDLESLQTLPHVLGAALDARGVVTVLVEKDEVALRDRVAAWGQRQVRVVEVKVVGPLIL